jgi:hypothetical protein
MRSLWSSGSDKRTKTGGQYHATRRIAVSTAAARLAAGSEIAATAPDAAKAANAQ